MSQAYWLPKHNVNKGLPRDIQRVNRLEVFARLFEVLFYPFLRNEKESPAVHPNLDPLQGGQVKSRSGCIFLQEKVL